MTEEIKEKPKDTPVEEKNSTPVSSVQAQVDETPASLVEKSEDPNWKAIREIRKKERAEKEAAERKAAEKEAEAAALKAAMESAFAKYQPPQQQQDSYDGYESEEAIIEKKVQKVLEDRERKFREEQTKREQQELPARLRKDLPQFDAVLNQETLDYFEYHYPEIARSFNRLPNSYEKWTDLYTTVKKLIPNSVNAQRDTARINQNLEKPKSASSVGAGQDLQKNEVFLSEERKKANWERMQRAMKGI